MTFVCAVTAVYIQQLKGSTIEQMVISGQNLASMFNGDPHFAQQITSYMSSGNYYQQQQQQQPEVMEIMDE